MRILMINSVCGIRSTGRICTDQAEILESEGHECKIAYGREAVPKKYQRYAIRIGNDFDNKIAGMLTRLTDRHGFSNKRAVQLCRDDYGRYDLFIGMDGANIRNMHRILNGDPDKKIYKLMEYTSTPGDVSDPWYSDRFDIAYDDISRGCEGLLETILKDTTV